MGLFDDLFGGIFDLNKDGHIDIGEEVYACLVLSEMEDRVEDRKDRQRSIWDNLD